MKKIIVTLLGFCLLVSLSGCSTMSNLTDKITGRYYVAEEFFDGAASYAGTDDSVVVMENIKRLQRERLEEPPTEEQRSMIYRKADTNKDMKISPKEADRYYRKYFDRLGGAMSEKLGDNY